MNWSDRTAMDLMKPLIAELREITDVRISLNIVYCECGPEVGATFYCHLDGNCRTGLSWDEVLQFARGFARPVPSSDLPPELTCAFSDVPETQRPEALATA